MANAIHQDEIWRKHLETELDQWCKVKIGAHLPPNSVQQVQGPTSYKAPSAGDEVALVGLRRRRELNGAHGQVVGAAVDSGGRIEVRVLGAGGVSRTMMIRAGNLMPLGRPRTTVRSTSTPSLRSLADDSSSVRTCSTRAGSMVSSAHSRAQGSAAGRLVRSRSTLGQVGVQMLVLPPEQAPDAARLPEQVD
eukprot:CAMPEP_0183551038 /NCGR_PEP_ID=MMETSP0371-20130417/67234_1 /TAXON_ID=268820 /ORGANISM="Peridinium aciculiferum, Strain PAER-2" /LENGTH=191 /DNA_ID=CAMNT_0025755423 /DNA_START=62 /DNA_END=637 /DNA_ORIENTATION=-